MKVGNGHFPNPILLMTLKKSVQSMVFTESKNINTMNWSVYFLIFPIFL